MKFNPIITGATGMVGEGVMHECLQHPDVEKVLIINRRPSGFTHARLTEVVHPDLSDLTAVEDKLVGYDACFFCAGVSSIGKKEPEFRHLTYDLTISFATTLARLNPDSTFCYISGAHTDSTENGNVMWARVKGKTENDLMKLPFRHAYAFRPGFMLPTKGLKNTLKYYKYVNWMYPLLRRIFPNSASTLKELADSMINVVLKGYDKPILEVRDIIHLAHI